MTFEATNQDVGRGKSVPLFEEGALLAGYILRQTPSFEAIERYADACAIVFAAPATAEDTAMLRFLKQRPWSLPFLDAASALLRPEGLLRKKLLLMLSILETTPNHVDVFTPRPRSRVSVVSRVLLWCLLSAFWLVAGLVIYAWSRRVL